MPGHDEKTGGPAPPVVSPVEQEQPAPEPPRRVQSQGAKSTSERPSLWTRIQESWITELVALIVSAGAIAAIVGLLSKYNETELPEWNGVSLNSLVSWLTTAAGICIGYVAGTSIGQLRWAYMARKARRMEDLKLFNGADGVVGALELLWRLRLKRFPSVTLLAILLAIGLDPFSQNLIDFYDNHVVDATQTAMVTRGRWYETLGPPRRAHAWATNPVLKSNVDHAIVSLGQSTNASLPQYICNTGNCTYPAFATLAYQANCTDLSDRVERNCTASGCSVGIRGSESGLGYHTIRGGYATLMAAYVINARDAIVHGSEASFLPVFQALRIDMGPDTDPYRVTDALVAERLDNKTEIVAQECVITQCVRSIEASVRQGVYRETVLDTYVETEESNISHAGVMRPPWGPDKGIQPGDDNTFGVLATVESGMWEDRYPQSILTGNISTADAYTGLDFETDQLQNIFFANVSTLEKCPFTIGGRKDPFACAINAMAEAYTQTVRDAGYAANGTASEDLAMGETLVMRTFIRVEWPWITLHVAVWLLTAVGWGGTVWQTKRLGIPFWRNDPMPMVYMYADAQQEQKQEQQQKQGQGAAALAMDMETGGDDMLMRLRNEGGHMRLVREA
ncbi:hypothetical protein ACRE_080270 [Hapsidospora chrysogenum ATCC 11550]|uniref:Uncharacterized protein n=1 Tax=Hapsidospora chrysogenum (strain ATCC 11550 / CBS 779.69 / DSM 880 / IAM 14645 / JCM 23072 / IMI 49137) TaxID=857340 RepID=A0A086SVZ0_HAPC1|nr:hypothetical protein ACRE_080270 [Hapsidospora chrysogenum ATCC 11550]